MQQTTIFDKVIAEEPADAGQFDKLSQETTIVIIDILKVDNYEREFSDNGKTKLSKKKLYTVQGGQRPLLVPLIVHGQIKEQRLEYGDKLRGVKIKRQGQGLDTRYSVFPILSA